LNKQILEDDLGPDFKSYWALRPAFIHRVLTKATFWCDQRGTAETESCQSLLKSSLKSALDQLAADFGGTDMDRWRWGARHQALFEHLVFRHIPVLSRWTNLVIPSNGGNYTINRGTTRPANAQQPYAQIHGAGYRGIYDLKSPENSSYVIATGQSGHPFSRHYGDFLKRWRDVRYKKLDQTLSEISDGARAIYRFSPAESNRER